MVGPKLHQTEVEYQFLLAETALGNARAVCGKLIDKRLIVIEGVRSDIPNPTAATFNIRLLAIDRI